MEEAVEEERVLVGGFTHSYLLSPNPERRVNGRRWRAEDLVVDG